MSAIGGEMHALVRELYPLCRSITGDGVRETLRRVAAHIDLETHEVPSGTPVLDWVVPPEWNVRDAWIKDADGKKLVDFQTCNLHLVSYSVPFRGRLTAAELDDHLYSLPDHPDWIPYRTAYYEPTWGFCVTRRQRDRLREGEFDVCVDTSLEPGHLTYGELVLAGERPEEVLFSVHVCHPSLANDNLSGIAVATYLARELARRRRRLTYRFLFVPGTIGSICWLARHREQLPPVRHGATLVCLGDARPLCYKRSFEGTAEVDRAFAHIVERRGGRVIDFFPYGYDERQYGSPGPRLPVGSLMRGRHGEFPEYHTSADTPDFVRPEQLHDALETLIEVVDVLEGNGRCRSLSPWGEPQLGKRGIYRALGGEADPADLQMAMLWLLSMADGTCDLLAIAERASLPFGLLARAAGILRDHQLLEVER
jgi:aminopeptidase-like protein